MKNIVCYKYVLCQTLCMARCLGLNFIFDLLPMLFIIRYTVFCIRSELGMQESGVDKQNVMRLRINRIALIQELRVEHVLRYLTETAVLTEDDLRRITSGSTPADKARVLVDILTGTEMLERSM